MLAGLGIGVGLLLCIQWKEVVELAQKIRWRQANRQFTSAAAEYSATRTLQERELGPDHSTTLNTRGNWARWLYAHAHYSEAEAEYRAVVKIQERTERPNHPGTVANRNNVRQALFAQPQFAEPHLKHQALLQRQERELGAGHPDTLKTRSTWADWLAAQGKPLEAEAEYRDLIKITERMHGLEHPDTLKTRSQWADWLAVQSRPLEAEAEYRALIEIAVRVLGTGHSTTMRNRNGLVKVLFAQGKTGEAQAEFQAVIKLLDQDLDPQHSETLGRWGSLAEQLHQQARYTDEVLVLQVLVENVEKLHNLEGAQFHRERLATALFASGKFGEAETVYRLLLKIDANIPRYKGPGPGENYGRGLEAAQHAQGKYTEVAPDRPDIISRNSLAIALGEHGKYAEAETELRAVLKLQESAREPNHRAIRGTLHNLALCLRQQGNLQEALKFTRRAQEVEQAQPRGGYF